MIFNQSTDIDYSKSGIYKITCEYNKKVYIGSSVDILTRYKRHCYQLETNTHPNSYLQSCFNKNYTFIFEVVQFANEDELEKLEYNLVNQYNSLDRKYGFNQKTILDTRITYNDSTIEVMRKKKIGNTNRRDKTIYIFENKETKEVVSIQRYEFIEKYNLNPICVCNIINGKVQFHKNWSCKNPKFEFISKGGRGNHMTGRKLSKEHKHAIIDGLIKYHENKS